MKPGPSEDYKALLRGEITSEEYVERLKADVDERLAQDTQRRRGPLTMATAAWFEEKGLYELAEIARKYAIDRPRWWHRFTR